MRFASGAGTRPLAAPCSLIVVAALLLGPRVAEADERDIFGWVERVVLREAGFELKAKLDTGAETSSLDAVDIRRFKRGGESWVRFTIEDHD